jgi:hypothetical protein
MKKILTLKHWQLVALIVLPSIWTLKSPFAEILNMFSALILLVWIYSIGFYGQKTIELLGLKSMNRKLFQLNILLLPSLAAASKVIAPTQTQTFGSIDFVIAVLGIYSGFAIFQVLFFAAKTFATIECRREVFFSDYFKTFFQIACFILGIWTLQPRINRVFTAQEL